MVSVVSSDDGFSSASASTSASGELPLSGPSVDGNGGPPAPVGSVNAEPAPLVGSAPAVGSAPGAPSGGVPAVGSLGAPGVVPPVGGLFGSSSNDGDAACSNRYVYLLISL